MFIKVGSKFINLSEILFFEQIDNKEQGSFTIKLFFSDSLENCLLLESQEAQNFLNYLNELDDIYPTESSRQVEYYSNHNSTNHSKELSTIEESSDVPPPPILETLKKQIQSIKMRMEQNLEIKPWDVTRLRESTENIHGRHFGFFRKGLEKYSEEINEVQSQAFLLADEAEVYIHCYKIDQLLMQTAINVQAIEQRKKILIQAHSELEKRGKLTEEYKQKIKRIKEQDAWFRAKKKISEAEVMISVGNTKKAQNLYKEANAVLKQDWSVFFPGEEPPIIDQPFSKQLEF
jgi:hypothetical protein